MYRAWKANPGSVHASWAAYFKAVDAGAAPGAAFVPPPGLQTPIGAAPGGGAAAVAAAGGAGASAPATAAMVHDRLALAHLIRAYAVRGHEVATLDPLGLANRPLASVPELDYTAYGFSEADLDRTFDMTGVVSLKGFLSPEFGAAGNMTLRALLAKLSATYCGRIGWEYMHITSREKCNWIRERVEHFEEVPLAKATKLEVFDRLASADIFERFLAKKFNTKRFGLEGAEVLVPGLEALSQRASSMGVESVVIGMPHRGRLNVLVNLMAKPMTALLSEFMGTHVDVAKYNARVANGDWSGSGDVKYHLGASCDRTLPSGANLHLTLLANPSHLEAVDPLVVGKTRAKQDLAGDKTGQKVMAVLMHGDAAFAGQGVVMETFLLSQLEHYKTGGTVHVIVNNQVGFTTDPKFSRSTLHCSDLGKAFDVPILHVNADDPEAVTRVFELAGEYRQTFKSDVIIDLVGYRRHGHNEQDQAAYTQPLMAAAIAKHPTSATLYAKQLVASGVLTEAEVDARTAAVEERFAAAFTAAPAAAQGGTRPPQGGRPPHPRAGLSPPPQRPPGGGAGAPPATPGGGGGAPPPAPPRAVGRTNPPRLPEAKAETITTGAGLDWATAEALAFGSLLLEGTRVRLSGQDVERGTFSHRHAVLHDQTNGARWTALEGLKGSKAAFEVTNSPLSEYGVMGFELGYAMESPRQLVLWEAQFGDFANGAQIIVDQFLSSGETKWARQCGLTLLLPHGYEGQGPEHSSCRVERYLQMVRCFARGCVWHTDR